MAINPDQSLMQRLACPIPSWKTKKAVDVCKLVNPQADRHRPGSTSDMDAWTSKTATVGRLRARGGKFFFYIKKMNNTEGIC
jgi:TusA-related sulfurtransferase